MSSATHARTTDHGLGPSSPAVSPARPPDVLPDTKRSPAKERIEQACEYFDACLLMPRVWMKRAYYGEGIQDVPSLARLFNVSWLAMRVRLEQLGFVPKPEADDAPKEAA